MPRENEIRELAYSLWNDDGAPEGRAMEYWLIAEKQLGDGDDAGSSDEQLPPAGDPMDPDVMSP